MKLVLDGCVGDPMRRTYTGPVGLNAGLAVKQGATDRTCATVTGPGQQCLGLIEETDLVGTGMTGQVATGMYAVIVEGETFGVSGAPLACDIDVMADANGNLVPSTAQGDFVIGRTRTSCSEAGDQVIVFVRPYTR